MLINLGPGFNGLSHKGSISLMFFSACNSNLTVMQRRGSVVASKPQPPLPKNSKLLSHKQKLVALLEAGKAARTPHYLVQSTDNHHRLM